MEEIVVNFIKSFGPGATVALGLFFIFASADGYVSKEFRAFLSGHLKRLKAPKKHNRWPDTFLMMFRKLFGKKVFSGKFFFRSCTASFLGIIIMVAVWGLLDPKTFSSFIEEQIAPGGQFSWNILYLFLTPVFFNFFPDYISLAESQCVIAMMRGRNIGGIFLLILADVLFTFAIFWGSFILLYALIILASIFINFKFQLGFEGVINYFFENLIGYIRLTINEFIKPKTFLLQSEKGNLTFGIFFYSTFFTSVWVWLYAASVGLIRFASRSDRLFRAIKFILPIEEKPLRAIGTVAFIPAIAFSGLISLF